MAMIFTHICHCFGQAPPVEESDDDDELPPLISLGPRDRATTARNMNIDANE